MLTVHQTVSDVRGNFYQEKTVFLRCTVSSNPPARFIWKRGSDTLSHSQDNGVDIYEPLYTQVRMGSWLHTLLYPRRDLRGLRSGDWPDFIIQCLSGRLESTQPGVKKSEQRGQSESQTGGSQRQPVPWNMAG